MRVGVVGAGGKMGATVCRTVLEHPDLDLVAAVDPLHAGSSWPRSSEPMLPGWWSAATSRH